MLTHPTRRWLAGIGVAGAFVAVSAAPAVATPEAVVTPYFQGTTMVPDSSGVSRHLTLTADRPAPLPDASVRYDFRALAGKITVAGERPESCTTPEPGVLVCEEVLNLELEAAPGATLYRAVAKPVRITPTDKAKRGDSGTIKIDVLVAGKQRLAHTSRVRIGEGVDLAGGPGTTRSAAPGGKFSVPLTVANVGDKTVEGFAAVFELPRSFRPEDRFSNCRYAEDRLVSCEFDEEIPAGGALTSTLNFQLGKDTMAPTTQSANARFLTKADLEDLIGKTGDAAARAAKPGTGPRLTLRTAPKMMRQADQTDVNPGNDYTNWSVKVTGKNGTDLVAIGATVKGKVGDVVTATVGFRNAGPATLDRTNGDYEDATQTRVELPPGTTAVGVPENCGQQDSGSRWYLCGPGMVLVAGETYTQEFRLRIDKVVPNAKGLVWVNGRCDCPAEFPWTGDIKPSNDKAALLVNPSDGGGAGDGDSLPITGSPTTLTVGVGSLLLVAGAGGYLVARRRRTHFVA
ncbi:LPXTG cell wall anchor domain-containing protein [Micromonospora okii]|uniref:LPXTG cell wall anchor domain-containing protein n=1 Tax=Micromonospora okii TaxID=1182970 RepID=UPI001E5C93BA|nr:LPXTG cell wall anchor domain-containing protein [Micromonospora okii]